MTEVWKPVVGYETLYEVSNFGGVKSMPRYTAGRWLNKKLSPGRLLNGSKSKNGYVRVCLSQNGISKQYLAHRLVGVAYIPNPDNKPQINHKDGDKLNNKVDNLEWCTSSENLVHAWESGLLGTPNNTKKTHCPQGHPYNEANTSHRKRPGAKVSRECKICNKSTKLKWVEANRDAYNKRRRELRQQRTAINKKRKELEL